jgi:hypothetical protein
MSDPTIQDVLHMQQRIISRLARISAAVREPRIIHIDRDSDGKVKGATASAGKQGAVTHDR